MCACLETLTIAANVFATTFRLVRPGPVGRVSDDEIVALAVAQAITGLVSDRRFLGTIGRLLPGLFPDLRDQSQYNRRLRRLTPHITLGIYLNTLLGHPPRALAAYDGDEPTSSL
jgi:hypothetical protein